MQAYNKQTTLGWDQFLRGRVSIHWGKVYKYLCPGNQKSTLEWSANLISSLLKYTASLWQFRCGILHGHTKEQSDQKHMEDLKHQVTAAYQEYSNDPFIVSRNLSSLFTSCSLESRLHQNRDTLTSWLRSFQEARKHQTHFREHMAATAQTFFLRRNAVAPP